MKKRLFSLLTALALCLALAPVARANNVKLIALTFDDGPSGKYTPILLEGLRERGVKCTFFMLGSYVELYPDVVRQVYNDGHQIASHTYSHTALSTLSTEAIQREVNNTAAALNAALGIEQEYMVRLPYGDGFNSSRVLNAINAPSIWWSVDPTNGQTGTTEEQFYQRIVANAFDGAIILMHDAHGMANINGSLRAIDTLLEQGYEFVTVEELFRLKGVTPQKGVNYFSVQNKSPESYDETYITAHWAWPDLRYLQEKGLLLGDGAGLKPNEYLTRAMAVTLLWRLAGEPVVEMQQEFSDVGEGDWYAAPVGWAHETGLVVGYGDGTFLPMQQMTRQEFYKVLGAYCEMLGITGAGTATAVAYRDDARIADWALPAVTTIRQMGFASVNDIQLFRPQDIITRGEAAELLHWCDLLLTALPEIPEAPEEAPSLLGLTQSETAGMYMLLTTVTSWYVQGDMGMICPGTKRTGV